MGMVEEELFERKKNKNESEREGEKWMQGRRKRKQAGRKDQDSPVRPRRSYPGIFLSLVSQRAGSLPQPESLAGQTESGS